MGKNDDFDFMPDSGGFEDKDDFSDFDFIEDDDGEDYQPPKQRGGLGDFSFGDEDDFTGSSRGSRQSISNGIKESGTVDGGSDGKGKGKGKGLIPAPVKNVIKGFFMQGFIKRIMPILVLIFFGFLFFIVYVGGSINSAIGEAKTKDKGVGIVDKVKGNVSSSLGLADKGKSVDKEVKGSGSGSVDKEVDVKGIESTIYPLKKPIDTDKGIYKVFSAGIIPLDDELYQSIYNWDEESVLLEVDVGILGKKDSFYDVSQFKLKTWYSYVGDEIDASQVTKDVKVSDSEIYTKKGKKTSVIGTKEENTLGDGIVLSKEKEIGTVYFLVDRKYRGDYVIEFLYDGVNTRVLIPYNQIM